jgi:LacI family transcriptional regulator
MSARPRPLVIGFCSPFWQEVANWRLDGVVRYVDERGDELAIRDFRFQQHHSDVEHSPPPPWTGVVDGVIICFGIVGSIDAMQRWLARGGAPVVSLVREWRCPQIPIVDTDSGEVVRMAADYFIEQGYPHIAFVGDGLSPKDTPARREIFVDRLARRGVVPLAYDLTFRLNGSTDDLRNVLEETGLIEFLLSAPKPLAIFALNDNYARAVSLLCEQLKIDSPREVAILGCGNLSTSRCHSPRLSTVQTDNERVGYEAARVLHAMMNGESGPVRPKLIRPRGIIARESTGDHAPPFDEIGAAVEFIRQHACEGIGVDDVVRVVSVSRRSLESRFADRVGQSPKQLIQQIRLDRATHLLRQSGLSITQIAMMTGFGDVAAFTNFIRKRTGRSPSQLRAQSSENHE